MTVTPLPGIAAAPFEPDAPLAAPVGPLTTTPSSSSSASAFSNALENALGATTGALERADVAERAFASGRGGLQEMILERAQADVSLSIAGAVASRVAQSLTTILGMQV